MAKFTAEMKHNAKTIEKLVETQQRTFQFGRLAVNFLIAVGLIIYGIYANKNMITPYIALIAGCTMITGPSMTIKRQARKLIQGFNNSFPKSEYTFTDDGFKFYTKGAIIPYSKLCRLIEDKDYMYLYISRQSAYMVDKSTVSGSGNYSGLKDFLKEKTGLNWSRPNSIFTLNFISLINNYKSNKKNKNKGAELK